MDMTAPVPKWAVQHGYLDAPRHEILRTVVGSGLHGMAIEGTDDHDEMGVYVEPPNVVFDVARDSPDGSYVARTQPEGARSGHGDVDLTLYSLRKYLRLATVGNPTVLLPLFADDPSVLVCTDVGQRLRDLRTAFPSVKAGRRFLGYLDAQRQRLTGGGKRNRVPKRPELVAAHGYDTKYASHALRLGWQGVELMSTGAITLPMPEWLRGACLTVKRGDVDYPTALAGIDEARAALVRALDDPVVPPAPDYARITAWSITAHRETWP